jgi:hypothetical protein
MTRRFGRVVRGTRVHDAVPKNYGRNVTILSALSCRGLGAVMGVDGATDAAVFRAFVTNVAVPILQPGDIVVMEMRTRSTASAPRSRRAGPACCTCRHTRPNGRRLSRAGPSSRPVCARGAERGP